MQFSDFESSKILEHAGDSTHLTDREKHLIGIAVTSTRGCIKCTGSRIKKAMQAGVAYESIVAAVDLTAAVNAGVTLAIAIQGAEREAEAIAACKDGVCEIGL